LTGFRVAVIVVAWAVVVVALLGSDVQPQVVVLAGFVCIITAAGFLVSDLVRSTTSVIWARAPQPLILRVDDDTVAGIVSQIQGSRRSSMLRNTLLLVTDERLLDRHGIDRTEQPEAAHALLGPGLTALLAKPRIRFSDAADLHQLLDEIESI
jgi:hypothetical protein